MAPGRITIGNVEILSLSDGSFDADPVVIFPQVPREAWQPYRSLLNESGQMTINVGCFLVRTSGQLVLIDSGIGGKPRGFFPRGRLPDELASAGVRPEDIDLVALTHLHVDHVGWNTVAGAGGWVPFFPRARYVVTRDEWEFWTEPERAAQADYITDSVLPLALAGVAELVEGEYALTDDLRFIPTPGHTPGHVSIGVASAGEFGLVLGDLAHHPAQFTEPHWQQVFDTHPALAMQTRHALAERIERERLLVAAGHFAPPGFGRLVQVNGRRFWRAA